MTEEFSKEKEIRKSTFSFDFFFFFASTSINKFLGTQHEEFERMELLLKKKVFSQTE